MTVRLLILDFDGTFTDSEIEGAPFAAAYPDLVAAAAGAGAAFGQLWPQALEETRRESPIFGWRMNGCDAAPADADPYIRCSMAAHKVLDRLQLVLHGPERDKLLSQTYQQAYVHSGIAFRPHACAALQAVLDSGVPVVVVTNSSTAHVQHKIRQLGLAAPDKVEVYGNAMKFWVDASPTGDARFDALPAQEDAPLLGRPLWLKRNKYFERIAELMRRHGADPATTVVCGDIYELDLALPAALGSRVALMRRFNTYAFEVEAVQRLGPRGRVLDDLRQLAQWLMP